MSVAPGNVVWDLVINIGFAVACGLLAGAAVVAVGMLVVGIPYARGKMAETRARNARRSS